MYLILIIIVLILFASATIIRRAASHVSQVLREREEIRFATNSLVEGGGFEPSVPHEIGYDSEGRVFSAP